MIEYAFKKGGSNNISARFRGDALQLLNGTNLYIGSTGLIQFEGPNSRCIRNKSYSSRTQQQTELLHYLMQQARWCYKIVQISDQIKNTSKSQLFPGTVIAGDVTVSGYIKASKGIVQTVASNKCCGKWKPINTWSEINSNYRVSITPVIQIP